MEKMYVSNKALLVSSEGKILVMHLKDGRWDLPGGRMDEGEQMRDGLAQLLDAIDPHFRRRERVTPGDEADALRRVVRCHAERGDGVGRNHHGLEDDFHRNRGRGIKRLGNFL